MKKLFNMLPLLALFASCGFGGSDCNCPEPQQTSSVYTVESEPDVVVYTEEIGTENSKPRKEYLFNDLTAGHAKVFHVFSGDLKGRIKSIKESYGNGISNFVEFDRNGFIQRIVHEYEGKLSECNYSDYVFDYKGRLKSRTVGSSKVSYEYYPTYVLEHTVSKNENEYLNYENDTTIYKYSFDENAMLTGVSVEKSDYIVQEVDTIVRGLNLFNEGGTEISLVHHSYDNNKFTWYQYDEDNYQNLDSAPVFATITRDYGQGDYGTSLYITIYKFDSHGNWIQARSTFLTGSLDGTDGEPWIEKRAIEYY